MEAEEFFSNITHCWLPQNVPSEIFTVRDRLDFLYGIVRIQTVVFESKHFFFNKKKMKFSNSPYGYSVYTFRILIFG